MAADGGYSSAARSTQDLSDFAYTPRAGGIDFLAQVVAHEFSHRDMFIDPNNWGGFGNANIGGPVQWGGPGFFYLHWPGYDEDPDNIDQNGNPMIGDCIKDTFEDQHGGDFRFDRQTAFSILRWWTGDPAARVQGFDDDEMHARLWGSWGFMNGSLDALDWVVGGHNDY
jgi:hypothetical protein